MSVNAFKLLFRIKFGIHHPIRILRHLCSASSDFSKIPMYTIEKYIINPRVILEAGAADGVDTKEFSQHFPNAKVIAIEPVIEQYLHLIEKFKDAQNVEVLNFALSEQEGISYINLGRSEGNLGGMGSSSLLPPKRHAYYFPEIHFNVKQKVQTKKLSSAIDKYDLVDLLWLDIQGKELEVLSSSLDSFMKKVKVVHLEISRVALYTGMPKERELRKFLKNAGFRCAMDRVGAISGNALYINTRFFPRGS